MKIHGIGLMALAAVCGGLDAQAYCMQPSAPYCATSYGEFSDQSEFDNCKSDLLRFQSDVESFVSCKQREVDEANRAAEQAASEAEDVSRQARSEVDQLTSAYNDAVRSFNARADGY